MEPSEVQNVEETEQNTDPETMKQEESQKIYNNPTRLSALDSILKSLLLIDVFTKEGFTEEKSVAQLHDFLVKNLNLTDPQEENDLALDFFPTIMELLRRWSDEHGKDKETLSSLFEVHLSATKTCNRCKKDMKYPDEHSSGVKMTANTLREIKYAFREFTFENVLKTSKITLKMPCDKEGCGKENYVLHAIEKLPSVFTIALEWEYNETSAEIVDTTRDLATELDIKEIYKYEGDSEFTKYNLVAMVCKFEDLYNCVGYKDKIWVRYFNIPKPVTGNWNDLVGFTFQAEKIRPVILFFEQVVA